jgi:two-component system OmpR family response regulator
VITPPTAPEARLLVVDDEPNIRELLLASLRFSGFEVTTAADGQQALTEARTFRRDLIVMDVMMPGLDGLAVVPRLRDEGHHWPVVFLTARDATEDKVAGLTAGGDYVTKPFSLEEVVARIRAVLRRTSASAAPGGAARSSRVAFADLELDDDTHEVWKDGQLVALSPTEFKLLRYFMFNAEPEPGPVEGADPRPRLELRLRRRRERRGVLRVVPAPQARHGRRAAAAHAPGRGLPCCGCRADEPASYPLALLPPGAPEAARLATRSCPRATSRSEESLLSTSHSCCERP